MKNRFVSLALVLSMAFQLEACSTTSGVVVNRSIQKATYTSVYIVSHGGNGADMDANLQREFLRHGLSVTTGAEGGADPNVDLIARYADDWKWDIAMYLRSFDLMLYSGKTNALLADGNWKNSTLHGFYGSEKVVTNVVEETLSKIMVIP